MGSRRQSLCESPRRLWFLHPLHTIGTLRNRAPKIQILTPNPQTFTTHTVQCAAGAFILGDLYWSSGLERDAQRPDITVAEGYIGAWHLNAYAEPAYYRHNASSLVETSTSTKPTS